MVSMSVDSDSMYKDRKGRIDRGRHAAGPELDLTK